MFSEVFAPSFFEQLEDRLSLAVYDINAEHRMGRLSDLRERFGGTNSLKAHIGGGSQLTNATGETVDVKPNASDEEIAIALNLLKIDKVTRKPDMSAIDRLKAKALEARNVAPDAIREFEADLDGILAEKANIANQRAAAVTPHKEAIASVKGEIGGLKSAIDILTND